MGAVGQPTLRSKYEHQQSLIYRPAALLAGPGVIKTMIHPQDFLQRLPETAREALLRYASRRTAARGEFLFQPGHPGNNVYFLETGRVKIYHLSPTGREVVLWFCAPGEIFGLAEVCQGSCRQVYAEASVDSKFFTVSEADFKLFLAAHPAASLLVNDVLASRLRSLGEVVQSLVVNDVNMRVSQLLLWLAASHGQPADDGHVKLGMPLTHQEMADMIGTTRQSVSTALGLLRRQGAVRVSQRCISVVPEHLHTLLSQAGPAAKTHSRQ